MGFIISGCPVVEVLNFISYRLGAKGASRASSFTTNSSQVSVYSGDNHSFSNTPLSNTWKQSVQNTDTIDEIDERNINTFFDVTSSVELTIEECSFINTHLNSDPLKHSFNITNNAIFFGIENFLRNWAITHNITASAVSDLLVGLKENVNILPTDARTLLKTNLVMKKICVEPGNYVHFDLETQMKCLVNNYNLSHIEELHLLVNTDGLPLFKSSPDQASYAHFSFHC